MTCYFQQEMYFILQVNYEVFDYSNNVAYIYDYCVYMNIPVALDQDFPL